MGKRRKSPKTKAYQREIAAGANPLYPDVCPCVVNGPMTSYLVSWTTTTPSGGTRYHATRASRLLLGTLPTDHITIAGV